MDVTLFGYWACRRTPRATPCSMSRRACQRFSGDLGLLWYNDEVLRTARE